MDEYWTCPACGKTSVVKADSDGFMRAVIADDDCCKKGYAAERMDDLGREILNHYWLEHGCEGVERLGD